MSAIPFYTVSQLALIFDLPRDRLYDAKNKGKLRPDVTIAGRSAFSVFRLQKHLDSLADSVSAREYVNAVASLRKRTTYFTSGNTRMPQIDLSKTKPKIMTTTKSLIFDSTESIESRLQRAEAELAKSGRTIPPAAAKASEPPAAPIQDPNSRMIVDRKAALAQVIAATPGPQQNSHRMARPQPRPMDYLDLIT